MNPIERAIEISGGTQATLAEKVGVSQGAVSKWVQGGKISLENIRAISAATQNQVTEEQLLNHEMQKLESLKAA